jgi:hypothetical protein
MEFDILTVATNVSLWRGAQLRVEALDYYRGETELLAKYIALYFSIHL